MKEYWTDTILESLVPAGTDVVRGEPVRIYKADEVAELVKRGLKYTYGHTLGCNTIVGIGREPYCDCGYEQFITEAVSLSR